MDEVVEGDDVAIPEHPNISQLMTKISVIIGIIYQQSQHIVMTIKHSKLA